MQTHASRLNHQWLSHRRSILSDSSGTIRLRMSAFNLDTILVQRSTGAVENAGTNELLRHQIILE